MNPTRSLSAGRARLIRSLWVLAVALTPASLCLLAVVGAGALSGESVGTFTRDPATLYQFSPHVGLLSNLGVVVWCVGGTCALFAAGVVWRDGRRGAAGYLLASGLLTCLLMLDDLYLIHDAVLPAVLGVPEQVTLGCYGLLAVGYLAAYRRWIAAGYWPVVAAAGGLFGLSLLVDATGPWPLQFALEDGFKFLGIAAWTGYLTATATRLVTHTTPSQPVLPAEGAARNGRPKRNGTPHAVGSAAIR